MKKKMNIETLKKMDTAVECVTNIISNVDKSLKCVNSIVKSIKELRETFSSNTDGAEE